MRVFLIVNIEGVGTVARLCDDENSASRNALVLYLMLPGLALEERPPIGTVKSSPDGISPGYVACYDRMLSVSFSMFRRLFSTLISLSEVLAASLPGIDWRSQAKTCDSNGVAATSAEVLSLVGFVILAWA